MRVLVLGGAGDMGSRAVEDLAASDGVQRVTIADKNESGARALAHRLRDCPGEVQAVGLDADDAGAVVELMRQHDVAASALGPFYRFERPMAAAAIEAGIDYTSLCDDWSATRSLLAELDGPAKEAGVIILTGLGASPGITNVGVRYFAEQLDRVRRVDVSVFQPLDAGGGEAVLHHMLFIMSGKVATWRAGREALIPACSERREVEFPRFGRLAVWNMGHPEPVTVPRFVEGVEECNFLMGFGGWSQAFVVPSRLGLFDSKAASRQVVRLLTAAMNLSGKAAPSHGALRLDVWGEREGKEVHHMACGVGEMRATTGLALSVGTQMLARGELTMQGGGVYAPEGCLMPKVFLERLQAKGITAYRDLAMTGTVLTY